MKTVQEAFREADDDELIKAYLYNFPETLDPYKSLTIDEMTIREYKEFVKKQLKTYLHQLRTLPTKKPDDGKIWIFFEERCFKDEFPDFQSSLVSAEDLREKGVDAPSYAYEFTEQAEVLGYYIANNLHTQNNLYDLLSEIMDELSFFGFKQEDLHKEKDELDRRIAEVKSNQGEFHSIDELMADFDEDDPYTDKEQELEEAVVSANTDYIVYSRKLEIEQILKDLDKEFA